MPKHYLAYWLPETAKMVRDRNGHNNLVHAASNQFARVRLGDTVWIVTQLDDDLRLLTRITVVRMTDNDGARSYFQTDEIWDADHHIFAAEDEQAPLQEISLSDIVRDLRFISKKDRLIVADDGTINPQQLQTMRQLTEESAALLQNVWMANANTSANLNLLPKSIDLEKVRAIKEKEGAFDPSDLEDARKRILGAIVLRQGRARFRTRVLQAYDKRCAVSECNVIEVLEAAHIVPYLGPGTDHVTNALLLRADIHTLFDLGLVVIDPRDCHIMMSSRLKGTEYSKYVGRKIRLPIDLACRPNRQALDMRFAEFQSREKTEQKRDD